MKSILAILFLALLLFTIGCSSETTPEEPITPDESAIEETEQPYEAPSEQPAEEEPAP